VPVLFTKSLVPMYETLLSSCVSLSKDKFKDVVGASSLTLIGPRGIGKTTTLKNMVYTISILFPQIIPIYVNYVNILANRYTQRTPILQIVADRLAPHNIEIDEKQDNSFYPVREALQESGSYVLLIVDEMDKLYEVQPKYDCSG
jgi:Cdc6-like AAA superfamily ATPase